MSAAGALKRRKPNGVAPFVYTGIQMVSKRLFEGEHARRALLDQPPLGPGDRRGPLFGAVHQGLWFDIGRPQNIAMAEELLGSYA